MVYNEYVKRRVKGRRLFTSSVNPWKNKKGWTCRRTTDTTHQDDSSPINNSEEIYSMPVRLPQQLFELAKDSTSCILPGRLRPTKTKLSCELDRPTGSDAGERITGNFILNLSLVEEHFNEAVKQHLSTYPDCNGIITASADKSEQFGWGFASSLRCTNLKCSFETLKLKFYEEEEEKAGVCGRRSAKINVQMAIALTKQPIGYTSMIEILSSCDVSSPSVEGMRKSTNRISDDLVKINRHQLTTNRSLVKEVTSIRTGLIDTPIRLQTDAAYNNCPRGRSFSQPGRQAISSCGIIFSSLQLVKAIQTQGLCERPIKLVIDDLIHS